MDNQRESIIQTAGRLFEQFGIRSVTIDSVCNELRISKKTFYIYFPQKEDLVDAVLTYQTRNNFDKYEKLFKNKNAIDSLILIIRDLKKRLESESLPMCYDLEKYYPRVYKKHEAKKNEEIMSGFEMNIRQGIAEGYYRDDLDIELISLFHSLQIRNTFELMQLSPKKYPKKRLADFFIDLMIHLIANENGLKYMDEHYSKTE
jgi:AcrR family transcriptional regulator